jgi:uncharacterized protein (DUF169 family)
MPSITDFNKYGEEMERLARLRTSPIAVKMLTKVEDIPEGAVRPWKDRGQHIAQCQAFALSRRHQDSIAMLEEDNWCFAPIIAYGMEDKPKDPEFQPYVDFPTFARDKYIGIVSAPLPMANFVLDVVLVYSDTTQMRNMLMPLNIGHKDEVDYYFFPPACTYQVVTVMNRGRYMVTLPDPGDYMRALADEDEIIISIPAAKMEEFGPGFKQMAEGEFSFLRTGMYILNDFPQPSIYQTLFERWGLYDKGSDKGGEK